MKTTFVVALAVLVGVTAAIAQTPMRPGLWENTMQMQMAGSPIQMPAMKSTRCVTPEQSKDPASSLPSGPDGGRGKSDCKMADYKVSGNTATWKMVCTSPAGHDHGRRDDVHRQLLRRDDEERHAPGSDDDEDRRQARRRLHEMNRLSLS